MYTKSRLARPSVRPLVVESSDSNTDHADDRQAAAINAYIHKSFENGVSKGDPSNEAERGWGKLGSCSCDWIFI